MDECTVDFYDGLAADYHLVYGDQWDDAVTRQGSALARLIRAARPSAGSVLDCSCGIGTQAIGLAREGFQVIGTDVAPAAVARARREAQRWAVAVNFAVADFRELDGISGPFDVVVSADNALPHLLHDEQVMRALTTMRTRLCRGGLLIVTVRDYDRALSERPPTALPLLIAGPPRRVLVRLHDWDSPDSPLYTVRILICTEQPDGQWSVVQHQARYRAITRGHLSALLQAADFTDVHWQDGDKLGYHQPIVTATAA